jgi:hypothetical protein
MPQLDKVTFLSQFFWLCVVFLTLYLVLVKFFLPSIARIVKVRQALAKSGEADAFKSSNTTNDLYAKSIQASIQAFQSHASFLERWSSKKLNLIVPKISPNFQNTLLTIRTNSLLAENALNGVVPPVGRQQKALFDDTLHQQWFTAALCRTMFQTEDEKAKAAKTPSATTPAAKAKPTSTVEPKDGKPKASQKSQSDAKGTANAKKKAPKKGNRKAKGTN